MIRRFVALIALVAACLTATACLPPPNPQPPQFPNAATTGILDGTTLAQSGSFTVSTDGQIVDSLAVSGTITVDATDVQIRNTRFTGSGEPYGVYVRSGNVVVTDSEFTGTYGAGIAFDNWTAIRCDFHDLSDDGAKLGNNANLFDSWMHDWAPGSGAHADGVQVQNGIVNGWVQHNTIDLPGANAAIFAAPDLGPSTDGPLMIRNNLLGGGGYTLFNVDGNNGQFYIEVIGIEGNRFLRDSVWGPVRNNVPVTWLDNAWYDTGEPILLP